MLRACKQYGGSGTKEKVLRFYSQYGTDFGVELLWLANVEVDNRGPQSLGYSAFVLYQNKETKYL